MSLPGPSVRSSPRLQSRAQTSTPTPNTIRHRQSSHLRSSIISTSSGTSNMVNARQSPLPPHHSNQPSCDGEVFHRDHSLISFEWQIQGLEWLKRSLEEAPISGWTVDYETQNPETLPELLRRGVIIGEGWYKLDLARTIPPPSSPDSTLEEVATAITEGSAGETGFAPPPTSLTLYITSPTIEPAPLEYAFQSAIFVGIRSSLPDIGQRHSYTRWMWHTSLDHEFSKDSEFAAVALPPLEELSQMSPISGDDGFTLCVQLSSPAHQKPDFTPPNQVVAPISLIQSLAGLLDSTSGDVQFVCLEHCRRSGDGEGTEETVSRKRIIYAHSEILKIRSDYFKSLLAGGFKEVEGRGGKVTVLVDDADFDTVYWLLHFIYCNELRLAPVEDVRVIMNRLQLDRREVKRALSRHTSNLWSSGEWEYRSIPLEGELDHDGVSTSMSMSMSELDMRSEHGGPAKSVSSVSTSVSRTSPPPDGKKVPSAMVSTVTSRRLGTTPRPASKISSASVTPTSTSKKSAPPAKSPTSPSVHPRGHLPMRLSDHHSPPDPHSHPCSTPPPASALAIYMLAHRYRLDVLEELAKERILKGLTIENCMPMLFATHAYEALNTDVLDFVVDCFGSVQLSPQFHVCIKEVSSGVWGDTGGDVLVSLFRRL